MPKPICQSSIGYMMMPDERFNTASLLLI